MIAAEGESYLIVRGKTMRWSFAGYSEVSDVPRNAMLLTPPSTMRALSVGYCSVMHASAQP